MWRSPRPDELIITLIARLYAVSRSIVRDDHLGPLLAALANASVLTGLIYPLRTLLHQNNKLMQ